MATGIKTGGRTKGTTNKTTGEVRKQFSLLLENNFDKLQNDIDALEPKDRIKTILELARFVIPILRSTELTTDNEKNNFLPIILNLGSGINPNSNDND